MAAAPRKGTKLGRAAAGLPRYYMDTGWWRSPRFAGLPLASIGLVSAAVSYCTEHSTDGRVPADPQALAAVLGLRATEVRKALAPLVERGLFAIASDGSAIGSDRSAIEFAIRGWSDHNPTKAEVEAYTSAKSEAGSFGNHKRWHVGRNVKDPACVHCQGGGEGSDTSTSEDRNSDPTSDRTRSRTSDRKDIANASHGMGWDGIPPQGSSQLRSRPHPGPASAGAPAEEENHHDNLPPSYRTGPHAGIAHLVHRTGNTDTDLDHLWTLMAHQHLERHTANSGQRIRHPEGWLTKDAELTANAYTADARTLLGQRPDTWLDLIAEILEPDTCSPLDGGTHRAAQAALEAAAYHAELDQARAERDAIPVEQRRAIVAQARAGRTNRRDDDSGTGGDQ